MKHIDQINENPRELYERNYHSFPTNTYDYHFTLPDDNYLYVLQTNIRMCNGFSEKWHWYNIDSLSRFYKISKDLVKNYGEKIGKSHDTNYKSEHLYDEVFNLNYKNNISKKYGLYINTYIENHRNNIIPMYKLKKDRYDDIEYFDSSYWTRVIFDEAIPNRAIELIIPKQMDEFLTVGDKISYILSYKPSNPFVSGK